MKHTFPRIVLAGSGGDCGKTMLTLGLLSHWRRQGHHVSGFKKGPDFIDAAWISEAAGSPARNLDVYLMGDSAVYQSFVHHARRSGISVIEGSRGIFDGMDAEGTYSTAELAKLLQAPVILILDATKITRTLAAFVLGCLHLDPQVQIAGVILNRVAGERHENVVRRAIEQNTGVDVLGALPKMSRFDLLPERHLGLVTPEEHGKIKKVCDELSRTVAENVDVARIFEIAHRAPRLAEPEKNQSGIRKTAAKITIGYFQDSAFTFYYPENLEALAAAGAHLTPVSPLEDSGLPPLDCLYIGGGFPETHGDLLSRNRSLLRDLKEKVENGLPVYAECGGLIFLSQSLKYGNEIFPMSSVLPFRIEMKSKPCGHGYCEYEIDRENPFFPVGVRIRGHEFHYSTIVNGIEKVATAYRVLRGQGTNNGREGFFYKRTMASYFHVHASSFPAWADCLIDAAKRYRRERKPELLLV